MNTSDISHDSSNQSSSALASWEGSREQQLEAGCYAKRPLMIVRGSGATVEDAAGKSYIDCVGGIAVANVGHANPRIVAAITEQAGTLITCPEMFYNDVRARYLEELARSVSAMAEVNPSYSHWLENPIHTFLCNSGTEAIETAIKAARFSTGRTEIVATLRGFHGRTMGSLSATWDPHYREPFAPLVPGFRHVRYNDSNALAEAVTDATAAVIIEVVQGEGGVRLASLEFLRTAQQVCQEHGSLLIFDEVQTGFGRTGRLFAFEHSGITPDILCLAKGIAGGVPMGATCLGPRVRSFSPGIHGSTFGGNPLACAAALATLHEIREQHLCENAATMGNLLLTTLRNTLANHSRVREVRGLGLLIGIELREHVQPYLEQLTERGVLVLQAGQYVIRLAPPLVITEQQILRVAAALQEVLQ